MPIKTQTKEEVTQAFLIDLKALLQKYSNGVSSCEIEAEDHYSGYPECGEDVRMTVTVPSIYTPEGETIREWTEIDLGRWFTHEKTIGGPN